MNSASSAPSWLNRVMALIHRLTLAFLSTYLMQSFKQHNVSFKNVLIYFCIMSKVKSHTKHILFCTTRIFNWDYLFQEYVLFVCLFVFVYSAGVHESSLYSFPPPGGLTLSLKRPRVLSRIWPHTGHSIHFIHYMTLKQEEFEGCDSKIVQNGTRAHASSMAFIRCLWSDETPQQCSCS